MREMLDTPLHNLSRGLFGSAINWSWYSFYAADALLRTKGMVGSKHSGVIDAFREHCIRPGPIEVEYGDAYGRVVDNRHVSDCDVEVPTAPQVAAEDLRNACRFVNRSERHL